MPTRWRLILERRPLSGARNMAVDHALHESVMAGGLPVLRLYAWRPACLSLGRNQRARGVFDRAVAAGRGIDIVRRPTGGLAVLHDREVTYAVAAPVGSIGSPRESYLAINRALMAGLDRLGVSAVAAPAGAGAPRPSADATLPCFAVPAPGEVIAEGRKLVGSAQRCERRTLLQHGSVLLGGSQRSVSELLTPDAERAAASGSARRLAGAGEGAVTLLELLGREPAPGDVAAALVAGFAETLGIVWASTDVGQEHALDGRVRELEARYATEAWTWRR